MSEMLMIRVGMTLQVTIGHSAGRKSHRDLGFVKTYKRQEKGSDRF